MGRVETKQSEVRGGEVTIITPRLGAMRAPHPSRYAVYPPHTGRERNVALQNIHAKPTSANTSAVSRPSSGGSRRIVAGVFENRIPGFIAR